MFLGGGGRGTLLLGHAHDEVNHSEQVSCSELRTYLSQNKRMSKANTLNKYNTNSMFEIKKIPIVHL